ncbi:hypothetical protein GE061_013646 [Apolygus lucorum]|uniref:Uncharacterized protein n=1 Tax=Apolygus lucorum TaxID=248454 RepID=A0A6A4K7G3_APOLU|nr:hypothetical protein GE061_013646 [Apolygus lucorum]
MFMMKPLFALPVTTPKGSLTLAKQFTILTLSLVTYSRGIFPAYAFSEKSYNGFAIKVLSGRRVCCNAYLFTKWLKSAFSALEKRFMRELCFEVMDVKNQTLEYYSLSYQYNEDSIQCSISASEKKITDIDSTTFQRSLAHLISSALKHMKRLEPLPEAFRLQLRIHYYDERTPENFIPDYFSDTELDTNEKPGTLAVSLGSIETPFHGMTLKIAGCYRFGVEHENGNKDGMLSIQNPDKKEKLSIIENQAEGIEENETKPTEGPTQKKICRADLRKTAILNTIQSKKPDVKSPVSGVKSNEKPSSPRTSKIKVCYRRKPTSTVDSSSRVTCVKCAEDNRDSTCLDTSLVSKKLTMEMVEKVAIFRQIVFKLRWFAVVSTSTLVEECQLSLDRAKTVIGKLTRKKLLTPSTRSDNYNVNTSLLVAFINDYFR